MDTVIFVFVVGVLASEQAVSENNETHATATDNTIVKNLLLIRHSPLPNISPRHLSTSAAISTYDSLVATISNFLV